MFTFLVASLIFLLSALPSGAAASEAMRFDVAVIGAGCGGTAAAIQAARMGMSVALVEESDWIGGQMTGAAVSTMDDVRRTRTGIYNEFINRARDFYAGRDTAVNICYWGSDTIAFEPWVGQMVLTEMIKESGLISIFLKSRVTEAKLDHGRVASAVLESGGQNIEIAAKVFIDATETGDFIPLTGARYRVGSGIAPDIDDDSVIQDITYVAVVKKYPGGLPPELRLTRRPPGYEIFSENFRKVITKDGNWWPGDYPYNVPVHNAYRALPDVLNPDRSRIVGNASATWNLISRTAINWANDYPGRKHGAAGMPSKYLEDRDFRRDADRMAMAETLSFIFYMQTELGMDDWSVDDRQGYGGYFSNDWQDWGDMPAEFAPILKHFPPFPYVRESRRIIGTETMTVKDVARDRFLRRTLESKKNAIALGEYPTDIHGLSDAQWLDKDLGERTEDIPEESDWLGGLFQIPIGTLIPEKIDGLLAAEKNISVSRVVNGSTRLQPVTMLTGQAAGALAAIAVKQKTQPRNVRPIEVQWQLLGARDKLSIYNFEDVPPESLWWRGVELALIHGFMEPAAETIFGVDQQMHWLEVRDAFRRAFGKMDFPKHGEPMDFVTHDGFAEWLGDLFGSEAEKYMGAAKRITGNSIMTKGELASVTAEIMMLRDERGGDKHPRKAPKKTKSRRKD